MRALEEPANPRDEDHVGHKVEWENDVVLALSGAGTTTATTVCDVLLKLHQGTHSKDAFTNNLAPSWSITLGARTAPKST